MCELPKRADCNELILGSPGSGNSENTSLGSHHPKKLQCCVSLSGRDFNTFSIMVVGETVVP